MKFRILAITLALIFVLASCSTKEKTSDQSTDDGIDTSVTEAVSDETEVLETENITQGAPMTGNGDIESDTENFEGKSEITDTTEGGVEDYTENESSGATSTAEEKTEYETESDSEPMSADTTAKETEKITEADSKTEAESEKVTEEEADASSEGNTEKVTEDTEESLGGETSSESGGEDFKTEESDFTLTCISGTDGAYELLGSTLTFKSISSESVYAISGNFFGNIVIDVGDEYKFTLEMQGFSLGCGDINPITVLSGDEVIIKAKKDSENYINDTRAPIDSNDSTLHSAAIYSEVDLEIAGKGKLTLESKNNNGIHSKDDLQIKNLTLSVICVDNALKGNDSVEILSGELTLIATKGDCIKSTNSDISEKGKQRGIVTVSGGKHTLFAACDGIDAAYDVIIEGEDTELYIYTDKYSEYSDEVTDTSESIYYIRYKNKNYSYSVKYVNSKTGEYEWVNPEYHSSKSSGKTTYYYYSFAKKTEYDKMQVFMYSSSMTQGQENNYYYTTKQISLNDAYDTISISTSSYSWTNYTSTTQSGGFPGGGGGFPGGGMQDGNNDKGDHSTKGLKAANEIVINGGNIYIKSYDDAIHANNDTSLENGESPLGNVTIRGGVIEVYSNDDGVHADGTLLISGGTLRVTNSYEGIEGTYVKIEGGDVSVNSKDDGINATVSSGTAIEISGGTVYIYCTGDGIDSNSRASYSGIVFSGGNVIVIANSNGNSAIDTEQGYKYTGGNVIAIMPKSGMTSEAIHCSNFQSVGCTSNISLTKGNYLVVGITDATATLSIPESISAYVIVLGDSSAKISTSTSTSEALDQNGVCWKE